MKTEMLPRLLLAIAVFVGLANVANALTTSEADSLRFMKQEEKLARDVYQLLYLKWGHRAFAHIAVSEQRHVDAVTALISRYHLTDTCPSAAGEFTYPELQSLYDELVARGSRSLADALAVGVLIEQKDIADLKAALATTRERPIRNVFSNLLDASYNHLAAFTRALKW